MITEDTFNYLNAILHLKPTEGYVHNHAPIEVNQLAQKVDIWFANQITQVENTKEFSFHLLTISGLNSSFTFREAQNQTFKKMVTKLLKIGNNMQALFGLDHSLQFKAARLMIAKPNGSYCPHLHLNHLMYLKNSVVDAWLDQVKDWLAVVAPTLTISHTELGDELNTNMVSRLFQSPESDQHGEALDLVIRRTQTAVNSVRERTVLDYFPT